MIIVFLPRVVSPIICISFSSLTISLWLNRLYFSFLSSDKKKLSQESIQQCKSGHFIILSVAADQKALFAFFFFFGRKMKNFKGLKVHVLKHEMNNNIVLMASAVGWILQEKNERKSLAVPHQMMLSILLTASILFPVGICCSHVHFSLCGARPSSLFCPGDTQGSVFLVQVSGAACSLCS